jgi:exopolysaccharide production protein ExoQ
MLAFPFVRAFLRNPGMRKRIAAIALLMFSGLSAWTYYNWENLTYSMGKDPWLTGRVGLWGLSMTWIADRPIIGHGFDAFWSSYYGPAAELRAAVGWLVAPHAHNGLINLCLDLGLIGVLLFLAGFAITFRRALAEARASGALESIWPVGFLAFYFLYCLTETSFLSRNDLFWILYVATMFYARTSNLPAVGCREVA